MNIENEIKDLEKQLQEKKELQERLRLANGDDKILVLQEKYIQIKNSRNIMDYGKESYVKVETEMNKIQQQIEELYSEDKKLAIFLHSKHCHHNHTDGCSWFYDINDGLHDWNAYSHKDWLQKAQGILKIIDFETAKKVFSIRL